MAARNKILKWWITLLVVLAVMVLSLPAPSFAANPDRRHKYHTHAKVRVGAYGAQIVALALDIAPVTRWYRVLDKSVTEAKARADWKHSAYTYDHRIAFPPKILGADGVNANVYANQFKGGGDYAGVMPGYRTIAADGPAHADLYQQRVASWRERMKTMMLGNSRALDDISSSQAKVKVFLDDAQNPNRHDGYIQHIQDAVSLEALLNDELNKLNADVDRRLALDTEIALNEQLEKSDAVAAYALALGSWRATGGGSRY